MDDDLLIERYYSAFNARRIADAAALFTGDAEVEFLPGEREHGPAAYVRFAERWTAAFPNATLWVERIARPSHRVREVYLVANGTHCGVLDLGAYVFKPTGTHAILHLRELLEFRDGQIAASMLTVDLNDLITQLVQVDYAEVTRRLGRIRALETELASAADDPAGMRDVAHRLGLELDAARRALRPHFYR